MRVKILVSYDGSNYCGWQVQPNAITVQQVLEDALFKVTGKRSRITGSGRTDAGVHALGQVAHFDTDANIPPEKFFLAMNIHLPDDIKVLKSQLAEDDFHATRDAKRKTYRYSTYVNQTILPLKDKYSVQIEHKIDLQKMIECSKILLGTHDFKCMSATGGGAKTTVRTIYSIDIVQNDKDVDFYICGNGFLYNMVRIMVGTLIKVGSGRLEISDVEKMLETGKRSLGGKTLSAKGLTLVSVEY